MIRNIELRDIPRLKELLSGFEWTFGSDFMRGLVMVDAEDRPVLFVGAWQLAEVHLAIDPTWATPGARLVALQQIHRAMEKELAALCAGQVVTWMDKCSAFTRRLKRLGWVMSEKVSWHRRIG